MNPPQAIYGDAHDLEYLNREMLYGDLGLSTQNREKNHYSDPNERIRALERNSLQSNYGDAKDLESMNNEVLKGDLGSD